MNYDRRNATSSWSGYNHQGKVGIFLALTELRKLVEKEEDYSSYELILEKMAVKMLRFFKLKQ